jgi:hypothetical protein
MDPLASKPIGKRSFDDRHDQTHRLLGVINVVEKKRY